MTAGTVSAENASPRRDNRFLGLSEQTENEVEQGIDSDPLLASTWDMNADI